nr:retrovirus-related Pol polyprotein from transposon TNT 1-94 [Tanacetum cinerariifolium]
MSLGYQNPFYLKQAQKKQQSLYDGKVLLEKHDPPVVHDSEETLQLAQEIPNEEFSDDTIPSVARKFLNEEAAKFAGDFKYLAKEADESLAKHKALELEIECLLRAVVSQDIMSVVQNASVVDTSNLQTELERTKERFENCIIKKENEYATLWNDWYKMCDECKFDKISYDKAYKDMQQQIEWLQAQLGDLKGKSKDTSCVSDTLNPLSQKLENENVELKFQDNKRGTSANTKFTKQSIMENLPKVGETHALSKPVTSNSVPTPQESKVVKKIRRRPVVSFQSHSVFDNTLKSHNGLPKFKYHKEHLCPLCEQGKSKRASHPPKPVPNLRQRLHLLHMDLCGPMRISSINEKRYVLVIVDDYSRYTLVHFLRSKDEAPEVIKTFLKRITVLLQKLDISFFHVFGALCYPKNDHEDIGKLGAKGDIGFFIGYSADSCAYIIYNQRTKKIMETMNVSFNELSAMDFEQRSSKPRLQSITSGQISLRLDLTYALSTITTQQPTEGDLDLLFEAMYDDYIGGQPSATVRTVLAAQEPQVRQMSTTSTTIVDTAPTPTNSSSLATNIPNTSQYVDEHNLQQQQVQQQGNQAHLQSITVADNVPNTLFNGNTFVNPFSIPSTSAAES